MKNLEVFRGNSLPITAKVYAGASEDDVVDLAGCTVMFIVKDATGTEVIQQEMTIPDQASHKGYAYTKLWPNDTDLEPGAYKYEINVAFPGSPLDSYTVQRDVLVVKERI